MKKTENISITSGKYKSPVCDVLKMSIDVLLCTSTGEQFGIPTDWDGEDNWA